MTHICSLLFPRKTAVNCDELIIVIHLFVVMNTVAFSQVKVIAGSPLVLVFWVKHPDNMPFLTSYDSILMYSVSVETSTMFRCCCIHGRTDLLLNCHL